MMNLTGENIMVFAHEFNGRMTYSIAVSGRKYVNGQKTDDFIKHYKNIQFPRDNAPNDQDRIDITKSFLAPYETKDGKTNDKLVVQEWNPHYDWGD